MATRRRLEEDPVEEREEREELELELELLETEAALGACSYAALGASSYAALGASSGAAMEASSGAAMGAAGSSLGAFFGGRPRRGRCGCSAACCGCCCLRDFRNFRCLRSFGCLRCRSTSSTCRVSRKVMRSSHSTILSAIPGTRCNAINWSGLSSFLLCCCWHLDRNAANDDSVSSALFRRGNLRSTDTNDSSSAHLSSHL